MKEEKRKSCVGNDVAVLIKLNLSRSRRIGHGETEKSWSEYTKNIINTRLLSSRKRISESNLLQYHDKR